MSKQSIVIDSELECIVSACTWLNQLFESSDLSKTERYQIETCMVEGINNAVLHAYGGEGGHKISIVCRMSEEFIQVEIHDSGQAMPTKINKDLPVLDSTQGRGMFIIESWMDKVDYHSDQKGNTLRLTRNLCKMQSKTRTAAS